MECGINGCHQPRYSNKTGWCRSHHVAWFRYGDPLAGLEARFWAKVDQSGGADACWPWTGAMVGVNYGVLTIDGLHQYAHRLAYKLTTGTKLGQLQIDHLCFNHRCCNPKHLRPVTNSQNMQHRDGLNRNNTSGFRGVALEKSTGRWHACVRHNRQTLHLGYFDTAEEAGEAARLKRLELFTHNELDKEQP